MDWGVPTDAEVDAVIASVSLEVAGAAESIYGVSHSDSGAFRQAIKHPMRKGGIRGADGRKWGIEAPVTGISRSETEQRDSEDTSNRVRPEAFVTGLWDIVLCPEPGVGKPTSDLARCGAKSIGKYRCRRQDMDADSPCRPS